VAISVNVRPPAPCDPTVDPVDNMCETLHNGDDTGFTKIFLLNPNSHQFEYHSENVWLEHANV
jgi:hypothetical protein